MTIRLLCPSGHRLSVSDSYAGRKVRCMACKKTVYVPERAKGERSEEEAPSRPPEQPPRLPTSQPGPCELDGDSKRRSLTPRLPSSGKVLPDPGELEESPQKRPLPPPLPSKQSPVESRQPDPKPERPRLGPTRRERSRRQPKLISADVYQPDKGKVITVKWLALILGLVVAFSVSPVFYMKYLNLATAPGWARMVLLIAVVQAVYIAWMLNAPDWASVWVVMLVFAAVSAIYGTATAMAITTPLDRPMLLGMGEVRDRAGPWCGSVLAAMSLATYLCGRTSSKWRRSFELETAARRRTRR